MLYVKRAISLLSCCRIPCIVGMKSGPDPGPGPDPGHIPFIVGHYEAIVFFTYPTISLVCM